MSSTPIGDTALLEPAALAALPVMERAVGSGELTGVELFRRLPGGRASSARTEGLGEEEVREELDDIELTLGIPSF